NAARPSARAATSPSTRESTQATSSTPAPSAARPSARAPASSSTATSTQGSGHMHEVSVARPSARAATSPSTAVSTQARTVHLLRMWQSLQPELPRPQAPRVHTGLGLYACGECGKLFRDSSTCTKHQRTHLGLRPHTCTACGKSFGQGRHLLQHQWALATIRPYGCRQCGKHFRRAPTSPPTAERSPTGVASVAMASVANFVKHRHIHRGEQLYHCSQCGESFHFQPQLVQHQKRH
ncbi:hypothetical protein Nmel_003353, partial [Mimus melanotis]